MLLTTRDIHRIQQHGYSIEHFVYRRNHWLELKNKNDLCIFHNGNICTIYNYRPNGCSLYPLTYNKKTNSPMIDSECPYAAHFSFQEADIKKLFGLIDTLEMERKIRIKRSKSGPVRI